MTRSEAQHAAKLNKLHRDLWADVERVQRIVDGKPEPFNWSALPLILIACLVVGGLAVIGGAWLVSMLQAAEGLK